MNTTKKDKNTIETYKYFLTNLQNVLKEQSKENYRIRKENEWLRVILDKQFQMLCLYFQGCKQSFEENDKNAIDYYSRLTALLKECGGLGLTYETNEMLEWLDYLHKRNNIQTSEVENE